jgi:hypothetical protein
MSFRNLVFCVFDGNNDLNLNIALMQCIGYIKRQKKQLRVSIPRPPVNLGPVLFH